MSDDDHEEYAIWAQHPNFLTTSPSPPLPGTLDDILWSLYPLRGLPMGEKYDPLKWPHIRLIVRPNGYEMTPLGRIILEAEKTSTNWNAWAACYVAILRNAAGAAGLDNKFVAPLGAGLGGLECRLDRPKKILWCSENATLGRRMPVAEINLGLYVLRLAASALDVTLVLDRDHPVLTFGSLGPFESLEFPPLVLAEPLLKTVSTNAYIRPSDIISQPLWDYAVRHRAGFDSSPPLLPVLAPVLLHVGQYRDATLELLWTRFDQGREAEWMAIQKITEHKHDMSPWFLTVLRYTHPMEMDAPRWAKEEAEKDRALVTQTLGHISRHLNIVCMQDGQWVY